eukprot:570971-Rhodomonas_salina.1
MFLRLCCGDSEARCLELDQVVCTGPEEARITLQQIEGLRLFGSKFEADGKQKTPPKTLRGLKVFWREKKELETY